MENFGALLNVALAVLSISTLAGLGLVTGRVRGLTQRAESADAEAVSLRARVTDRDAELAEVRTEFATYKSEAEKELLAAKTAAETTVAQLERDLEAIGRVVTNEAHIVALQHALEDHHAAALAGLKEIETKLTQILRGDQP